MIDVPYWRMLTADAKPEERKFTVRFVDFYDECECVDVDMVTGARTWLLDEIDDTRSDDDLQRFLDSMKYSVAYVETEQSWKEFILEHAIGVSCNIAEPVTDFIRIYSRDEVTGHFRQVTIEVRGTYGSIVVTSDDDAIETERTAGCIAHVIDFVIGTIRRRFGNAYAMKIDFGNL